MIFPDTKTGRDGYRAGLDKAYGIIRDLYNRGLGLYVLMEKAEDAIRDEIEASIPKPATPPEVPTVPCPGRPGVSCFAGWVIVRGTSLPTAQLCGLCLGSGRVPQDPTGHDPQCGVYDHRMCDCGVDPGAWA